MSDLQKITPMTSSMWMRYLVEAINSMGLDGLALAKDVGVDIDVLKIPEGVMPDSLCYHILNAAVRQSGNGDFGLLAANSFKPTALGALSYSMMTAENVQCALERSTRYIGSMTSATTTKMTPAALGMRFEINFQYSDVPEVRQIHEFCSFFTLNFLRWLVGRDLDPVEVSFTHKDPHKGDLFRRHFHCPVRFESDTVSMTFSSDHLAIPLITADESLSTIHDRYAEERTLHFGKSPYSQQIRRHITKMLSDGEPNRADIARRMNISERTLHRRLQDEGVQFNDLLNDVRQSMAQMYLANANISLNDTASLLGFSGQSSFSRATSRWFKATPREMRLKLMAKKI